MVDTSGSGIVIGRFMPPHRGHSYLIDFARSYTRDLTVFVCTLPSEPIPGDLRFKWMQQLFPTTKLVHITDQIPQASRTAAGAQKIWADAVLRHMERPPAWVFASEDYGVELARALGARFVPVDPQRSLFPISAGMIRSDPYTYWEYIPPVVRSWFVRRVSVVAESPARVADLAAEFSTIHATDYLAYRKQMDFPDPTISEPDHLLAAQVAAEEALLAQANRVLFLASDLLRTIFSLADPQVQANLEKGSYDALLERSRPDLVLAFMPLDPRLRTEMSRRNWNVRELDQHGPTGHTEAVSLVRDTLSHGK